MAIGLEGLILCTRLEKGPHGDVGTIRGIFNAIHTVTFPSALRCILYGLLTDVRAESQIELRTVHLSPQEPAPTTLDSESFTASIGADHRTPTSFSIPISRELAGEGEYRFELWHAGAQFGQKRLFVVDLRRPQ